MNRWTGPQSSGLPGKFRIPTGESAPVSMSEEQVLALKLAYTANTLSPASIYVGSPLVLSNVK